MQKSNSFKNLKPVIAIDGTAGSGKGTLAKKLANFIKFDHLDTGILYRICALEMLERKIELNRLFYLKSPHVCPEPVLVHRSSESVTGTMENK